LDNPGNFKPRPDCIQIGIRRYDRQDLNESGLYISHYVFVLVRMDVCGAPGIFTLDIL